MEIAETIIAEATPPGYGGISVIRISGIAVQLILQKILGKSLRPRYAEFGNFYAASEIIDQGIAIYFKAPNSFTGEDVLELQCHGGYAAVRRVMDYLLEFPEIRLATSGEFTKRAFLNGKIDLTQAEAVAELINANSKEAAKSALMSLTGNFSRGIDELKSKLIKLYSYLDGHLDFGDEEELSNQIDSKFLREHLEKVLQNLDNLINRAENGRKLQNGINVTIVGNTNAGKSSLFNALKGEECAIVTNIPGTTRDVLRETINLGGITLTLSDTAGFNDKTVDQLELEGIRRTNAEITKSKCLILVHDLTTGEILENKLLSWFPKECEKVIVGNKIDQIGLPARQFKTDSGLDVIYLSAKTGEGIDLLFNHLKRLVTRYNAAGVFSTSVFALDCLHKVDVQLKTTQHKLPHLAPELLAEELKAALSELGKITGEVTSEEILDQIFAHFCVGK